MGGIAQNGRASRAPIAEGGPVVQGPSITLALIDCVDDRLDRRMPTFKIGFKTFPRELECPGLLGDLGLDRSSKIQQGASAKIVAHRMPARTHKNRHHLT